MSLLVYPSRVEDLIDAAALHLRAPAPYRPQTSEVADGIFARFSFDPAGVGRILAHLVLSAYDLVTGRRRPLSEDELGVLADSFGFVRYQLAEVRGEPDVLHVVELLRGAGSASGARPSRSGPERLVSATFGRRIADAAILAARNSELGIDVAPLLAHRDAPDAGSRVPSLLLGLRRDIPVLPTQGQRRAVAALRDVAELAGHAYETMVEIGLLASLEGREHPLDRELGSDRPSSEVARAVRTVEALEARAVAIGRARYERSRVAPVG